MKTPLTIQFKWESLKERGDLDELVKLTGHSKGTLSRILNGQQNTRVETLQIIKDFITKREKELKKLEV